MLNSWAALISLQIKNNLKFKMNISLQGQRTNLALQDFPKTTVNLMACYIPLL